MANELTAPGLRKLALICGMFGSEHAGERAAAALAADRMVKAAGLTWLLVLGVEAEPAPAESDQTMVDACLSRPHGLSRWEADFLASLARQLRQGRILSAKQRQKLRQIYEAL